MPSPPRDRGAPRSYPTPAAFRQALEPRLRARAAETGQPLQRVQRLFVYDRFLARLQREDGSRLVLKGGLALEFRADRARSTMDIDLSWPIDADTVQATVERAGALDLQDFMRFEVTPDADHPEIENTAIYEGRRFRVTPFLGNRPFVGPFGVDVITGGPMLGVPDEVECDDLLDFAGIAPPRVRLLPVETHLAEKLHAYTLPRATPNSRVKDLPDIALLATTGPIDAGDLRRALAQTFDHRDTHSVPTAFPDPRPTWATQYARLAADNMLPWKDLGAVTLAVRAFLDPVLASAQAATWVPSGWRWMPGDEAVDASGR